VKPCRTLRHSSCLLPAAVSLNIQSRYSHGRIMRYVVSSLILHRNRCHNINTNFTVFCFLLCCTTNFLPCKKVKLCAYLSNHAMNVFMWHGGKSCAFYIFALDAGKPWVPCFDHFAPWEITPCTHWVGGWVNPRTSLCAAVVTPTHAKNWSSVIQSAFNFIVFIYVCTIFNWN
jgi:hypothetical protein